MLCGFFCVLVCAVLLAAVTFVVAGLYFAAKGGPEVAAPPSTTKVPKQGGGLVWAGIIGFIVVLWLVVKSQQDNQPPRIQNTTELNPASQPGSSPAGVSKPSNPEAKQKYELAVQYLVSGQPNWGVNEAVDIVVRYPDSHEALLSAILLMDNCNHIGFGDFYMLTGYRLPLDRELPRPQQIDILMSAFHQRGIIPKKPGAPAAADATEAAAKAQAAAEFERAFFQKYPDLEPHRAVVDAVAERIYRSGDLPESREARMEAFAKGAREELARQQQASPAIANNLDEISSLRADAEKGVSWRQSQLGWRYETGDGVGQDYAKAAHWYRLAAERGDALAQNNLARLCEMGRGVPQNCEEATKWYLAAAKKGNATAQNNLGLLLQDGRGVEQDTLQAYAMFCIAADAGSTNALANRQRIEEFLSWGAWSEAMRRVNSFRALMSDH
jgi:TPR repeat protein